MVQLLTVMAAWAWAPLMPWPWLLATVQLVSVPVPVLTEIIEVSSEEPPGAKELVLSKKVLLVTFRLPLLLQTVPNILLLDEKVQSLIVTWPPLEPKKSPFSMAAPKLPSLLEKVLFSTHRLP